MLRCLVVLPFYGGSLPIGRYAAEALKQAGCQVRTFEAPEFFSAFSALKGLKVSSERLDFLENSFLQVISQAVLAQVEAFQPDLVLCMAQAPLNRQALKKLRKDGVTTAMWFVEDYRLFTYWQAFAPYYDIFAVIQKEPFVEQLSAIGVPHVLYLPLAALPELHKPMELSPQERKRFGSDLSFLGAGYPNRREMFRQLVGQNFKIWGTEWEGEPDLQPLVQEEGRRISPQEAVRIYNASAVNLNLHSSVRRHELVSQGDFVNPRTFELAACRAFQLVDRRSLMPELFAEDELAVFDSPQELLEKVAYYLARPEERQAIAQKGQARVLRDHTYTQRMQTLLNFAQEAVQDFGKQRRQTAAWSENLPLETQAQLSALVQELELSSDCSFDDLVMAVRGKNGALSDTESALLFMDEWRRQYAHK